MTNARLFSWIVMLAVLLWTPVLLLAQTPAPTSTHSIATVLLAIWHSAFMMGAIAGVLPVIAVDYQAFRAFKSVTDFKAYDWRTALFRWLQGFIGGGVSATILKNVVGM